MSLLTICNCMHHHSPSILICHQSSIYISSRELARNQLICKNFNYIHSRGAFNIANETSCHIGGWGSSPTLLIHPSILGLSCMVRKLAPHSFYANYRTPFSQFIVRPAHNSKRIINSPSSSLDRGGARLPLTPLTTSASAAKRYASEFPHLSRIIMYASVVKAR